MTSRHPRRVGKALLAGLDPTIDTNSGTQTALEIGIVDVGQLVVDVAGLDLIKSRLASNRRRPIVDLAGPEDTSTGRIARPIRQQRSVLTRNAANTTQVRDDVGACQRSPGAKRSVGEALCYQGAQRQHEDDGGLGENEGEKVHRGDELKYGKDN